MNRILRSGVVGMGIAALGAHGAAATFGDDVAFMKQHIEVVLLEGEDGARVALAPAYQGRVMTSTAAGDAGLSYGWINRTLIASGELLPHINVFGGEDRFWLGPEGGQFSIFFPKDAPFNLEHWQTPAPIDSEPFVLAKQSAAEAVFTRAAKLINYSGTALDIGIERTVRLLPAAKAAKQLDVRWPEGVKVVAFETENTLTNTGEAAWTKESGMLSIWILGMFNHSPQTTVVIPYAAGPESERGPVVNDAYFGKVPAERLKVGESAIFFSGDGQYRSKIGLSPQRATDVCGSYDAANGVLTVVQFTKPKGATDYVNSMWELQEKPFAGDVINSYNDGPLGPGQPPLGPFYELETSSPAAALKPGKSITHVHRTVHIQGDAAALDPIAKATLGVDIATIAGALSAPK